MTFDQFHELKEGDRIHWEPSGDWRKYDGDPPDDGTVESNFEGQLRVRWDDGESSVIYMWEKNRVEQITKINKA